ncbi:hypothetical protein ACHAW5_006859 [Stephanodiscus triporus]|uniref:Uncharacterized protein n=1 Tax=Stephanodiscus triporus TaxID=2934178 RepID=A0ABD3MVT5_9STRA
MTSTNNAHMDGSVECMAGLYNDETPGKCERIEVGVGLDRSAPHITSAIEGTKKDLLSRFKTYDDQLPSSNATRNTQYDKLHQHSPKPSTRVGEHTTGSLQVKRSSNDVVSMCSGRSNPRASQLQTPESQCPIDVSKKCPNVSDEREYPSSPYNKAYSRLWFGILRVMVILFSTASILAGAVTIFSGRMTIVYYMLSSPVLWIVRCYMAAFHLVLILVELDIEVPIIVPKKTLDNFLHKGYLISFIGLLDSCMSSNKTLEQILVELQGIRGGLQPVVSGYELQGGTAGWKISSCILERFDGLWSTLPAIWSFWLDWRVKKEGIKSTRASGRSSKDEASQKCCYETSQRPFLELSLKRPADRLSAVGTIAGKLRSTVCTSLFYTLRAIFLPCLFM